MGDGTGREMKRKSFASAGGPAELDEEDDRPIGSLFNLKKQRAGKNGMPPGLQPSAENPSVERLDSGGLNATLASFRKNLKGPKRVRDVSLAGSNGDILSGSSTDLLGGVASSVKLMTPGKRQTGKSKHASEKKDGDARDLEHPEIIISSCNSRFEDSLSAYIQRAQLTAFGRAQPSKTQSKQIASTSRAEDVSKVRSYVEHKGFGGVRRGRKSTYAIAEVKVAAKVGGNSDETPNVESIGTGFGGKRNQESRRRRGSKKSGRAAKESISARVEVSPLISTVEAKDSARVDIVYLNSSVKEGLEDSAVSSNFLEANEYEGSKEGRAKNLVGHENEDKLNSNGSPDELRGCQVNNENQSWDGGLKHCTNGKICHRDEIVELSRSALSSPKACGFVESSSLSQIVDEDVNRVHVRGVKKETCDVSLALIHGSCSLQETMMPKHLLGSADLFNQAFVGKSVPPQLLLDNIAASLGDSRLNNAPSEGSEQNAVTKDQCISLPAVETAERASADSEKLIEMSEAALNIDKDSMISSSLKCMVAPASGNFLSQSLGGSENQLVHVVPKEQLPVASQDIFIANDADAPLQTATLNQLGESEPPNCSHSDHQRTVLRATRSVKKRKHGDMTYEGDDDWEVLIHEPGFSANISADDNQSTTMVKKLNSSSVLWDAGDGGAAAVAAGLKAHAPSPVEKIKFKEVFKRKGGLQEYLECRNLILCHWSKDVRHILTLEDCGLSDTNALVDEPLRVSLIRDIFRFLDQHGFINSGIATERSPRIPVLRDPGLPKELKPRGTCELKDTISGELTAYLVGKGESADNLVTSVNRLPSQQQIEKANSDEEANEDIGFELSGHANIGEHADGLIEPVFAVSDVQSSDLFTAGKSSCLDVNGKVRECHCNQVTCSCLVNPWKRDEDDNIARLDASSTTIVFDHQVESHVSLKQTTTKGTDSVESDSSSLKRIIVIGAGPAGLTAARHLQRQGYSVIVLEARGRIGGRVCTDHKSLSVPVDLGASIITGVQSDVATERRPDPSSLICTQLGLELTVLNSDCPLYDTVTGHKVPADLDESLEAEYNSLLDDTLLFVSEHGENAMAMSLEDGLEHALRKRRKDESVSPVEVEQVKTAAESGNMHKVCASVKNGTSGSMDIIHETDLLSPLERRVMNWHFANLEYGCAASLKEVSLPYWNQDDVYGGFGGAHCMIKGGYGTVLDSLGRGLDVRLNHVVTEISYDITDSIGSNQQKNKVKIVTSDGSDFSADAALITVPLGCLKANTIKFSPALPDWKESSIHKLGFGVLNKVVLEFPNVFWEENVDYFGATAQETDNRGHCFMFWNVMKTVGAPVLIALVVGKAAVYGQNLCSADHVNHALMVLRKLFGEASVPDPVAFVVTNWGVDPFSRGAYSYVAVGASGEDYDILGKPIANCLFFAGEATCKEHPDTVGGAMMSGLREAVRINDILTTGKDYVAEIEAMEDMQRMFDNERNELRDLSKRLDACKLSYYTCGSSSDGMSRLFSEGALLQDMFTNAKTTSGRLHLAKEMLSLPAEVLKSFAGTREGLSILNSWILDSLGKNATQLLRHCVRILVLVSTDLLAVRLSGIGKTIKEKVCVHTSRDIRSIASQLVSMWIEVFRKEKAVNGRLKLLRQTAASEPSKFRSKDQSLGFASLCMGNEAMDNSGALLFPSCSGSRSPSKANSQKIDKARKIEPKTDRKLTHTQNTIQNSESMLKDNTIICEEEAAAFAAAEAARAAAIAAAKAYASSETEISTIRELPKIPSFHKFARREQYVQMDEPDIRKRWPGGAFMKQDCMSEIDSRNCRVRDWSLDYTVACKNLEGSKLSDDIQQSLSNEIAYPLNLGEHSGESGTIDSRLTKAWVDTDTASNGGVKDSTAIERWQLQAMDADAEFYRRVHMRDEEDFNIINKPQTLKEHRAADGLSASHVAENKSSCDGHPRGVEHIKQGVVDYVTSLLMPLYKARKIDKEGYKSIMKKTATKVVDQCTEAEKVMSAYDFLDFRRKNKIRAFVDKLIERHMAMKPPANS